MSRNVVYRPVGPVRSRLRALAAVMPVALLLSACVASPQAQEAEVSLESFYDQELALEPCETPVITGDVLVPGECGHVEVPIDYENPDVGTAQIAVFRIPATGTEPIGSLFINPGGPGLPGIGYSADVAHAWVDSPITEQFDLVGFDPRGTGTSAPAIDCYTDGERDDGALAATLLSLPDSRPLVDACADSVGGIDVLAHLGTRDAARDLDVLRAVFGDEHLSYVGVSYGTRLGAVYAEMFPENVRALVFDGAIDPHTGTLERNVAQWDGLQQGFESLAEFCATQGDCPLGTQPDTATQTYQQLMRPLLETTLPAGEGRELSYTAANDGVAMGLYSATFWPAVVAGLTELAAGRGDTLLGLRDLYHERSTDGIYSNSAEATVSIDCLDEDRFSPEGQAELVSAALSAAPFLDPGTPVEAVPALCEGWPVEPTLGFPYATDIQGLPPTLTVSVTGDPVTPHQGGISLAETLGGSLLTVEGAQHGSVVSGNACIDSAVAAYLVDLTSPPADATCRL